MHSAAFQSIATLLVLLAVLAPATVDARTVLRVHVTRGETASKTLHVQDEGDVDITLQDLCDEHETAVSVNGVEGTFCVSGVPCVARIRGECPEPQSNLLYGSYCAQQQPSGLFECLPCSSWEQWRAHNGIQDDDLNDEDDEEGDNDSSE
ncbi:hypothetical protein PINS_up020986 [Pythium insidiosum]|nr:hypothetical protein PINS_up020986 [Pythium insidiosum]